MVADFPKLAASAAHLFGRPQVWNEEGGGPFQAGKFVIDYNLVRGMNFLQIRGLNIAPGSSPLLESRRGHRLVRQPGGLPAGDRTPGGPGRAVSPDGQHVARRQGI